MTCESFLEHLDAFIDESCTREQVTAFEDHLRACPSCAARMLARMQLKQSTRTATAAQFVPSRDFRFEVEKAVLKSGKPFSKTAWMPALATAFALGLVIVFAVFLARHQAQEQALAELLDLHVATLASSNPVDVISTDRHTVKPWFQGKLPFTFNLPELEGSPFRLIGGKLVYFKGSPGAQLLFEVRRHQISIFIFQTQSGSTPSTGSADTTKNGFSVEKWDQSGLRYTVVSDTTPADVHAFSELFRSAGHP